MPKFKSLLVSSEVVVAGRTRKCYHSKKCKIVKGDIVLEVKVGLGPHGYCVECAKAMIANASDDLEKLSAELAGAQ